jgi:Na+/proline symporter
MWQHGGEERRGEGVRMARSRRLVRLLRRVGLVLSVALIAVAVFMFATTTVSVPSLNDTGNELINGQQNTSSLLLPLALFAAGIAGLAACLR